MTLHAKMKTPHRPTAALLRSLSALALCICVVAAAPVIGRGVQGQRVRAVIDATKTYAPISKYVYGQFLEHIGSIVNKGLWAEMLDDGKFFYPVVDKEPEAAPGRPRPRAAAPLRRARFVQ
jgi:alpha-N-arabinofuranosidase